jgi:Anti-sigma factor NepR
LRHDEILRNFLERESAACTRMKAKYQSWDRAPDTPGPSSPGGEIAEVKRLSMVVPGGFVAIMASSPAYHIGRGARIPANRMTQVAMGRRPRAEPDFEAARTAIGMALRSLYSDVLSEPLPEKIAELLRQLDRQKGADDV